MMIRNTSRLSKQCAAHVARAVARISRQARQAHSGHTEKNAGPSASSQFDAGVLQIVACPFTKQRLEPVTDPVTGSMQAVRSPSIDVVWSITANGLLNMIPADAKTGGAQQAKPS